MRNNLLKLSSLLLLFACATPLTAQEEQTFYAYAEEKDKDLYSLSLEELMNVAIVSASSQKETLFDAPVSSYSITKEEISKSGVTSIPEALRLCPGVIVRETTNGNYDIHIRGFDNPVRYTETAWQINVLTLVMINNVPVFSNGQGGTYWEGLPIDLIDVERIEIVRGPSAALFGPNAVTGVINIITKDFNSEGWYTSANVQYNTPNSKLGSFAVGKKINNKLNVALTGNYQNRNRHDNQYYRYYHNDFILSENFRKEESREHQMALHKAGINGYVSYKPNENVELDLSLGTSKGAAQKLHFMDSIPLVFSEMQTNYLNLTGKVYNLNARISYTRKVENLLEREIALNSSTYNLNNFDATVDYNWKIANDKIRIRPAINIMQSTYDDLEYGAAKPMGGLLNLKESINSLGASLRADVFPVENLRLVASVRGDKFNIKDDLIFSYQFLSTYKLKDNLLFRAVHSNAKSGLYYSHSFMDMAIPIPMPDGSFLNLNFKSNPNDFNPASNTMTEVGVRSKISSNLHLDITLFTQTLTDLSELLGDVESVVNGIPTQFSQQNLSFKLKQNGATLAANYVPNSKFQFKPFVTFQKTRTEHFFNLRSFVPVVEETSDHDSSPSFYGGFLANYSPISRLNINLNSYFYGKQTMYHAQNAMIQTSEQQIKNKTLLNFKVSYQVFDKFNAYVGGKNLLNQDSREYYGTDRIGSSYFVGAGYNF